MTKFAIEIPNFLIRSDILRKSPMFLKILSSVITNGRYLQIFVAFLEYLNFKSCHYSISKGIHFSYETLHF